jgi:hypothetical protein
MPADVFYDHEYNGVYCVDCHANIPAEFRGYIEQMTFVELCQKWYNEKPGRLLCGGCEKNLSECP